VLVKVLWISRSQQSSDLERVEPELSETSMTDGIPVVPRAQRHGLAKVQAVEPVLNANELDLPFVANEELETVKLFVRPVEKVVTNVVQLAEHKSAKAAAEDEIVFLDNEFIDTVAMSAFTK